MTRITGPGICVALLLAGSAPADARGCIKGAIIGGIAGHLAYHGLVGAAAGCAAGRAASHLNRPNTPVSPVNPQPVAH